MARINIHQDLYNYERKIKGLTTRQIACLACGIVVCIGVYALVWYVLELPWNIALLLGLAFGAVPAACGFAPVWGMPAEVWAQKAHSMSARGNIVAYKGESLEPMKGELDRDYIRKKKSRRYECERG